MRAIWARRRRHRGWGRGWGHPSRLRTNRSENFVRLPACAGACRNPIWIAACVAGRQPLHVGACPRKLAGQANFALHTAHTRRCIVLRGASLSESFCSFEKLSNLASSADRRWSMLTSSSIMPFKLLGAMLVRSAAVELGSGTLSHQNGARPS